MLLKGVLLTRSQTAQHGLMKMASEGPPCLTMQQSMFPNLLPMLTT